MAMRPAATATPKTETPRGAAPLELPPLELAGAVAELLADDATLVMELEIEAPAAEIDERAEADADASESDAEARADEADASIDPTADDADWAPDWADDRTDDAAEAADDAIELRADEAPEATEPTPDVALATAEVTVLPGLTAWWSPIVNLSDEEVSPPATTAARQVSTVQIGEVGRWRTLNDVVAGVGDTARDLDDSAAGAEVDVALELVDLAAAGELDVACAGLGGPGNVVPPGVLPGDAVVRVGDRRGGSERGDREGEGGGEGGEDHRVREVEGVLDRRRGGRREVVREQRRAGEIGSRSRPRYKCAAGLVPGRAWEVIAMRQLTPGRAHASRAWAVAS
jgi:hypothetical protein